MEQVVDVLSKIDRRLENIESQVYKQNDRINCVEKGLKLIHAQNKSELVENEDKTINHGQSRKDNFINRVKAEMLSSREDDDLDYLPNKHKEVNTREETSGTKLRKNNSFNGISSPKLYYTRRSPHTVPSDKDEERRLKKFCQECLSKALQWSFVDLINAAMDKADDTWYLQWLTREEAKLVRKEIGRKNQFRRFLCVLRKKEFAIMQEWLNDCGLEGTVLKQIWTQFEEFSDKDTNVSKLKCFRCRLVQSVNVTSMADYLFSADILKSQEEYLKICSSERPTGAQDDLWKCVLSECEKYICQKVVVLALKVALMDQLDDAEDNKKQVYESLLSDIDILKPQELMSCSCDMRCSQSFHPPSCLKTMCLTDVYFSPPTRRKREKSSSSEAPQSSSSSNGSLDSTTEVRGADILSPDDDTELKKTHGTASDDKKSEKSDDVSKFAFRTQRSRSRSLRRKRSQTQVEKIQSDSSNENINGERSNARPIYYSYKSNTKKLNENKPCMIPVKAKTVFIDTGTRYIHVQRNGRSSESSIEV